MRRTAVRHERAGAHVCVNNLFDQQRDTVRARDDRFNEIGWCRCVEQVGDQLSDALRRQRFESNDSCP